MIRSTQLVRLDGLILCGSVDDDQAESALGDIKVKVKKLIRMFNKNSATEASIESDQFTIHYLVKDSVIFLCICDQSYPRKVAFTYLSDISSEFTSIYPSGQYLSSTAKSYGYIEFDTYIQKAKRSYQDSRATQNLDKLNDELKDVTKVMTKNIEELLYRGDSLDKMGEMSGRLREDSRKYKKAAVKINWDAMLAKVSVVFLNTALIWGLITYLAFRLNGRPIRSGDLFFFAFWLTAGTYAPFIMVALVAALFLTSLFILILWFNMVVAMIMLPAFAALLVQRTIVPGTFSGDLIMNSLHLGQPVDEAADRIWEWAGKFVQDFKSAAQDLSLR
ncbi:hypothetical protein FKW77_002168 [Venturia effusa]|uniref:Protein transport protein SEC22 n=1 Tax=Venturia effusa TaxID=50376 RepID=A0A517LMD3_9PEZI|nr:hypothetical protein FKW77_002168 [Venturia effusa]